MALGNDLLMDWVANDGKTDEGEFITFSQT